MVSVNGLRSQKRDHNLIKLLSDQELEEYYSCIWYTPDQGVVIEVGAMPTPSTQRWMIENSSIGLVGVTPTSPIQTPRASENLNRYYVEEFERKLQERRVHYLPCMGKSKNFTGADGCFILNTSVVDAIALLSPDGFTPTQLAILYLPIDGIGRIVSCID